jgi:hypothetical protein
LPNDGHTTNAMAKRVIVPKPKRLIICARARSAESWGTPIRLIKHEAVPKRGSYEVRFPDGMQSNYFYRDDTPTT